MKKLILFLMLLFPAAAMAAGNTVYLYNWTEYMPDQVLSRFTKETGIEVKYATYESNESMYAKVKLLDAGGYDLVFPSTYFVHKMKNEGLLSPIDKAKLKNVKHLDDTLLDKPYDPGNTYSV
ncbi:MAG: extracellular solute-binding protein, partial [Desulfobacterales bacterium]|nr:extracellular solute-binding protein [Desulfobacterales bacterium]